jgi:hypothetical protein
MSGPVMPVGESETLSPLQQELARIQPQAGAQIVFKDIFMPMAAHEVSLNTIIDDLLNLYAPDILIVPDLFNMALFNIMKKILVQAGASILLGRGYPVVKNVIKVLYEYDPEVLKEAQDRYSILSPTGIVPAEPTTLVFENTSVIPRADQVPVTPAAHLGAMHTAEAEYEQLLAERRVETALRKKPPDAADNVISRGNWVYVHREGSKSCTWPRQVAAIDGKCVYVHLDEQFGPKVFNITQLKPALLQQSQHMEDPIGSVPTHWPTHFTEILTAADDREANFGDAKRAEVLSPIDKGNFRIVVQQEAGDKPNIVL